MNSMKQLRLYMNTGNNYKWQKREKRGGGGIKYDTY